LAPTITSSFEVSSNSNQPKQVNVFCKPIAPITRPKKGIITYKTTDGIYVFKNILKLVIDNCGMCGLEKEGPKGKRQLAKKKSSPTPSTIFFL
jgi:hypothetical protein